MSHLKKATSVCLVAVMLFIVSGSSVGCYTQQHDVGQGSSGGERTEFRQWFALWGLVPITQVRDQVNNHTRDAQNYTITTQFTPLDVLIGIFTGIVTVQPKTVIIEQ